MQAMNEGYFPAWYHAIEALLLLIAAAIAALAIGTVMLGGDIRAAVAEETRAALAAAHDDTCQKLGLRPVRSHPEFARCVNLLVQLQGTHERFADARHGQ
jgi:hypothetical protein